MPEPSRVLLQKSWADDQRPCGFGPKLSPDRNLVVDTVLAAALLIACFAIRHVQVFIV